MLQNNANKKNWPDLLVPTFHGLFKKYINGGCVKYNNTYFTTR